MCGGGGIAFLCDYSKAIEPIVANLIGIGKGNDLILKINSELRDGCSALDRVRLERLKDKVSLIDRSIQARRAMGRWSGQESTIDAFLKIRQHFQSTIDKHS